MMHQTDLFEDDDFLADFEPPSGKPCYYMQEDRILVKVDEAEEKTEGGIILAPTALEAPQRGTVIEAGPGRTTDNGVYLPIPIHRGDVVVFGKYAGTPITLEGVDYLVLRASDVLLVIE